MAEYMAPRDKPRQGSYTALMAASESSELPEAVTDGLVVISVPGKEQG